MTTQVSESKAEGLNATMARWLIFSVILGVFPVLVAVLWEFLKTQGAPMDVSISHGQMILPAVGLCTAAIGRLLGKSVGGTGDILGGGSCVVLALIGSILFVQVNGVATGANNLDPARVVWFTVIFYVIALVSGGGTIYVAEKRG